jgi:hypothetical protein
MQDRFVQTIVELLVENALESTDRRVRQYLFTSAGLLIAGNAAFAVMVGAVMNWNAKLFAASLLTSFASVFTSALCFLRGEWLSLKSRGMLPPHAIWILFGALAVIVAIPPPLLILIVLAAVVNSHLRRRRQDP